MWRISEWIAVLLIAFALSSATTTAQDTITNCDYLPVTAPEIHKQFLPLVMNMAKTDLLNVHDLPGGEDAYIDDQLARDPDATAPPTPTGYSVVDTIGGITLKIDFEVDTAHLAGDFDNGGGFIAYAVKVIDSSGNPVFPSVATEIGRFGGSSWLFEGEPGNHYLIAIKAQDNVGNKSGFSSWQRGIVLRDSGVQDAFDGYGGVVQIGNDDELNWLQIARFEDATDWFYDFGTATITDNATGGEFVEGTQGVKGAVTTVARIKKNVTLDLDAEGRFTADDYLVVAYYVHSAPTKLVMRFHTDATNFYETTNLPVVVGFNYAVIKKSNHSTSGSPDWANINQIGFEITGTSAVTFDDWRLVKASAFDATTYSDTGGDANGDVWQKLADDNLADSPGEWHIYTDMPGHDYSLGQIDTTGSAEPYIAVREDRQQESATHACAMMLKGSDGQAGMLFRVRPGDIQAETPTLNAMFSNASNEAVGRTHTPTDSGVTYAEDSAYGSYSEFGAADELSYASVAASNSRNEFTIFVSFRPDFAFNTGSSRFIIDHYIDANNSIRIFYSATSDIFIMYVYVNGTQKGLSTSVQTFAKDTNMSLAVTFSGTEVNFFKDGVLEDSDTLNGNYTTSAATLHISNNEASANDFTGRIYQVLVEGETIGGDDLLDWHNGFLNGIKVASPSQRSYYSYALDTATANGELTLTKHRIGFDIETMSTAVAYTSAADTVYHLGIIAVNQDDDEDGDADQLLIRAFISPDLSAMFDGDNQIFAITRTEASHKPFYTGGVGFRSEGANVRFSNFRAGSPAHAMTADHSTTTDGVKQFLLFPELAATPATPNSGMGQIFFKGDSLPYAQNDAGTLFDLSAGGAGGAPSSAQYLTLVADGTLTSERTFTPGDGLDGTDAGAGSTYTVAVDVTDFIDTDFGLTEAANNIRVNLASPGGLSFNGLGLLQLDDSIAGTGLSIASKVLSVDNDHVAITLDANADTILSLSTQELGLDTQTANIVFAGPVSGGAVVPTFRALVDADIPSTIVRTSRTLTAGSGLTGGGNLSANRTFNVGAGVGITVNANDVALTTPGTLTAATGNSAGGNHTHAITTTSDAAGTPSTILAGDASGDLSVRRLTVDDRIIHDGDADSYREYTADKVVDVLGGTEYFSIDHNAGGENIIIGESSTGPNIILSAAATDDIQLRDGADIYVQVLGDATNEVRLVPTVSGGTVLIGTIIPQVTGLTIEGTSNVLSLNSPGATDNIGLIIQHNGSTNGAAVFELDPPSVADGLYISCKYAPTFISGGNGGSTTLGIGVDYTYNYFYNPLALSGNNIYRSDADLNTYIDGSTADQWKMYAGGQQLLDLYGSTGQDYVKIGDGGDVDINLNDMAFLEGSSGNLGIGLTTPEELLDVRGTGIASSTQPIIVLSTPDNSAITTGSSLGKILWSVDDNSSGRIRQGGANISLVASESWDTINSEAYLSFSVRESAGTINSSILVVHGKSGGMVGVGITSPLDTLHVEGAVLREGWFCGYAATQTGFTGVLTDIDIDTEVRKDADYYTHSAGSDNITVIKGGWYLINYTVNIENTGNDRACHRVRVYDDGIVIINSESTCYTRQGTGGLANAYGRFGTCSHHPILVNIGAGSVLDLRTDGFEGVGNFGDSDASYSVLYGSSITIERVDQT